MHIDESLIAPGHGATPGSVGAGLRTGSYAPVACFTAGSQQTMSTPFGLFTPAYSADPCTAEKQIGIELFPDFGGSFMDVMADDDGGDDSPAGDVPTTARHATVSTGLLGPTGCNIFATPAPPLPQHQTHPASTPYVLGERDCNVISLQANTPHVQPQCPPAAPGVSVGDDAPVRDI